MRLANAPYFLALFLSPAVGLAADLRACPDPEQLDAKVFMCGDDAIVADQAGKCSDSALADWRKAGAGLSKILPTSGPTQSAAELSTRAAYVDTIVTLSTQIASLQETAKLLSDYAEILVDFPDGKDDDTSAPCFNSAFHRIQNLVTNLDAEIVRAKKARAQAIALRDRAAAHETALGNSVAGTPLKGQAPAGATPRRTVIAPGPAAKNGASDITGIQEDLNKQAR